MKTRITAILCILSAVVLTVLAESRVYLLHSDRLYFDSSVNKEAQFLVGNVQFRHDDVLMWCDSALYYEASNSFDAFGSIRMIQGDTLSLTGDELYYNGLEKLARVRYNVVLKHRDMTLYTDSLDYDRLYNVGYFFEGGHLVDKDNDLVSDWGEYHPDKRDAIFNYNVKMVTPAPPKAPKTILLTDTLHYDMRTAIGHALGPSTIDDGSTHVYTESGYLNTRNDNMILLERSELNDNGKKLVGDSVNWNSIDSIGEAFGNVVYTDIINQNMMTGNYVYYENKTGYSMGTDSLCLIDFSQGKDTMYLHADTLKMYTRNINTDSVWRDLHAYHRVRMYRNDLQGVCDSLVYHGRDSVAIMYRDPIVWMGSQQMLGEEIRAFMNDSTIDSVQVLRQTLSCEKIDDDNHFNQISGHEIHSYLRDGEVYLTHVIGNVYVKYYPLDDDSLMIGLNHTESTELKMFMGEDRKLERMWMPAATGTLFPILKIPESQRFLENFQWFDYIRPLDRYDIYVWRGKRSGTELIEKKQRKVPLQKLENIHTRKNGNVQGTRAPQVSQGEHIH